jgi:Heterokaryon incompatibility protein (HET)
MGVQGKIKDYRYAALPNDGSIRMLILDSGEQGDLLRGTLEAVECNSAGSYESLSHVWGAPEWIHEILIREKDGGGRIKLTPSLFGALIQLRLPDRSRRIWVDQICIN